MSVPGTIGNLEEQSNGISVTGACSVSAFPRARADLASGTDSAGLLILEFVERKMTNIGEDRKKLKQEHKTSYKFFLSGSSGTFRFVRIWASSK